MTSSSEVLRRPEIPRRFHDISTVVSILPIGIRERKPGLHPGQFEMPPAAPNDFNLLVVERCHHSVYIDETRPRLIVPDPSDVVAESIVQDFKVAMLGYEFQVAEPGLGWVSGDYEGNKEGFKLTYGPMLEEMAARQMGWFEKLLVIADDDWARYKQHKFVTPLQKIAAEVLGQTDREWMLSHRISEALSKCKFCFSQVHTAAIICPSCRGVLNKEAFDKEYITVEHVASSHKLKPVS